MIVQLLCCKNTLYSLLFFLLIFDSIETTCPPLSSWNNETETCVCDTPIRCGFFSCVESLSDCPISTCPQTQYTCEGNTCVTLPSNCYPNSIYKEHEEEEEEEMGGYESSENIKYCQSENICWDHSTDCLSPSYPRVCPSISSCPPQTHRRCSDGSCLEIDSKCSTFDCPYESDILCPVGGYCVKNNSSHKCPNYYGCPYTKPIQCYDGRCTNSVFDCTVTGCVSQESCPISPSFIPLSEILYQLPSISSPSNLQPIGVFSNDLNTEYYKLSFPNLTSPISVYVRGVPPSDHPPFTGIPVSPFVAIHLNATENIEIKIQIILENFQKKLLSDVKLTLYELVNNQGNNATKNTRIYSNSSWKIVSQYDLDLTNVTSPQVNTEINGNGQSSTTNAFVALLNVDGSTTSSSGSTSNDGETSTGSKSSSFTNLDVTSGILISVFSAICFIGLSMTWVWYNARRKRQRFQNQLDGLTRNLVSQQNENQNQP